MCLRATQFAAVVFIVFFGSVVVSAPRAFSDEAFRLVYLPKVKNNLICFSRSDAADLLSEFRPLYLAEKRPRPRRILKGFETEFGNENRFDCAMLKSRFLPLKPMEVVDIADQGDAWEGRKAHYFVAAEVLVDNMRYVAGSQGETLYVYVPEGVIEKN